MIPEREREALIRLTMCAREECVMCKYKDTCDFDFQYETATKCMNILADALNADRETEPQTVGKHADVIIIDEPQTCNDCDQQRCETCVTEVGRSKPKKDNGIGCSKCESRFWCDDRDRPNAVHCNNYGKDEPQTDCKDCKYAWWNGERYECSVEECRYSQTERSK